MEVFRVENKEHLGPFTPPWPYEPEEFKAHVPWVNIVEGISNPDTGQVGSALAPDDMHPHHLQDIGFNPFAVALGLEPEADWYTATKDIPQLLHWFPLESLDWFDSLGFCLAVYDVPESDVRQGQFQLVFNFDNARLIRTESLRQLKERESSNERPATIAA